jgi:hypothetical protein
MQAIRAAFAALALGASAASGQTVTSPPPARDPPAVQSQPALAEKDPKAWSFTASVYGYILPDQSDYVQPSVTADRGWLHLEARYNYEAQETGSVWAGYTFSGGRTVAWELTPMLGGVFGKTDGVAPGYRGSLSWWKLEFSSEGEYVFDAADSADSFFYNWSELAIAPKDWFRVGLVTQRTRAYQSPRDIQRGLLVGFSVKSLDLTAYLLNPDDSTPSVVLAAVIGF